MGDRLIDHQTQNQRIDEAQTRVRHDRHDYQASPPPVRHERPAHTT